MLRNKIIISLIVITLIGVAAYIRFNKSSSSLSENEALSLLTNTIVQDSLYDSFTTLECLDFYNEEVTKEYVEFSIREIHGNGCEGDPSTSPRVDTYKIIRQSKNIFYQDWKDSSYIPYDPLKLRR